MFTTETNHSAERRIAQALAATPAPAAADPIFALITEFRRLDAAADAANALMKAAAASVGHDCQGFPKITPEAKALGVWGGIGRSITREEATLYRANYPDAKEEAAHDAARLEWWDRRDAEIKRNAEVSGYRALAEKEEESFNARTSALADIYRAEASTIAGAMAQLAIAIGGIKEAHASGCEDDFHIYGVFSSYKTLARLLAGEGRHHG
jgi:hypothetical protein